MITFGDVDRLLLQGRRERSNYLKREDIVFVLAVKPLGYKLFHLRPNIGAVMQCIYWYQYWDTSWKVHPFNGTRLFTSSVNSWDRRVKSHRLFYHTVKVLHALDQVIQRLIWIGLNRKKIKTYKIKRKNTAKCVTNTSINFLFISQ